MRTDLLQPYMLTESIELRNRLVMAPMTTWSSQADGQISLDELDYYRHRSVDVGMVVTGTTYVSPNGMGFVNQFYGGDDLYTPSLGRLAQAIHMGGAKAILQVFHAGRMSQSSLLGGNQIESASAVAAERPEAETPRALEEGEIYNILDAFYDVTKRAIKAGFDGVEIHGANTYLIQQFFSPHANRRDDYWGGDLERRMRFPIGVLSSVKRAIMATDTKDFIVGYRLSPEEIEKPGIRLEDTLKFVDILAEQGLTYLSISLNSYDQTSLVNLKDQEAVGSQIMKVVNGRVPVMGVGAVTTLDKGHDAREMGYDMVALGKSIIMNPDWVKRVKAGRELRQSIKLSERQKLYIPQGLMDKIIANEGWFNVKK